MPPFKAGPPALLDPERNDPKAGFATDADAALFTNAIWQAHQELFAPP